MSVIVGPETGEPVRRRLPYLPAMEGIRGFTLIVEIFTHLGLLVVTSAYSLLMPGGLVLMSVFFVLSGFFITVLLIQDHDRHGRIRVWRFLKGRGKRLYPPLLLILVVHWLIVFHYGRSIDLEWRDNLWALTNMMDYRYAVTGEPALDRAEMVILWSIGVEVKFYLLWPFLIGALLRFVGDLRRIILVLVGIAVASSAVRILQHRAWDDWLAIYFRFEGRLDAFAIGAILGFLWYHDRIPMRLIRRLAWPCWVLFIGALWLVNLRTTHLHSWGMVAFNLAAFVVIAACLDPEFRVSKWLSNRVLVLAGRTSFSFYLIHIQVYMWVVLERRYLPMWQQVAIALGGTLVFGTLGYLLVERPFLSPHRRRLGGDAGRPRRSRAQPIA